MEDHHQNIQKKNNTESIDLDSQPKIVNTSLKLLNSSLNIAQSLDEFREPDSLLSFLGHEEERSINFATQLFPSTHGENLHVVDDVAFSLIEFLKIKFANQENDLNSLLKNEWIHELEKNNAQISEINRMSITQTKEDEENIDISHEQGAEYRWELEDLKDKTLKVDNFMVDEDGESEENVYIPSFVHCSPKPQNPIEEPLQVDDIEDEDAPKVLPVQVIEEKQQVEEVEIIETLEFEDDDDNDREEEVSEEAPASASMMSFLLQLNRLPGNHNTQGLLEQYLAQKQSISAIPPTTTSESIPFSPDRHFTDVEEFEEVI